MRPHRAPARRGWSLIRPGTRALAGIGLAVALLAATVHLRTIPPAGGQAQPAGTTAAFQHKATPVGGTYQPLVGDFGSRNADDVFWYAPGSAADALWTGDTDQTFNGTIRNVSGTFQPVVGDFDGDGHHDIFWYRPSGSDYLWRFLANSTVVSTPQAVGAGYTPVVGNFDGAGGSDIFWYAPGAAADFLWRNGQPNGTFTVVQQSVSGSFRPFAGDFDDDGFSDIFWYRAGTGADYLWRGVGGPTHFDGQAQDVDGTFIPLVGDFDGDGHDDILWYAPGAAADRTWYGLGAHAFDRQNDAVFGTYRPLVGSFNDDATDDVFWYAAGSAADPMFLGQPDRSFTPWTQDVDGTYRPFVGDFDDDGGSDIFWYAPGLAADFVWYRAGPPPSLQVDVIQSGLNIPWDLTFAPDGTMLYTQRGGTIRALPAGTTTSHAVTATMTDLFASGETGLMGITVDPDFTSNRRFYTCQGHTGPQVQVVAWTINAGYTAATRVNDPLVGGIHSTSGRHGGCRVRFGTDGHLWIGTGDAASGPNPQSHTSLAGKVLRVDEDTGAGVAGNPFIGVAGDDRIFTYGHRNVQGLALRADGRMWSVEHGSFRDDEVNLLTAGNNFGWDPTPQACGSNPTYEECGPMTDFTRWPDATAARWSSGPSTIATSGATWFSGGQWGAWDGALAVATLAGQSLRVMRFSSNGTFQEMDVPTELDGDFGRLRTAQMGPDGALYITTSNGGNQDRILRVTPSI